MKVLRAKKYAKTKRQQQQQQESVESLQSAGQEKQSSLAETEGVSGGDENTFQVYLSFKSRLQYLFRRSQSSILCSDKTNNEFLILPV